jgi:hypothetical protein
VEETRVGRAVRAESNDWKGELEAREEEEIGDEFIEAAVGKVVGTAEASWSSLFEVVRVLITFQLPISVLTKFNNSRICCSISL